MRIGNAILVFALLIPVVSSVYADEEAEKSDFEPYIEHAILGLYMSPERKATLDTGIYYVLDKKRQTDASSIMGPTLSAAISPNSVSGSVGFGRLSSVSMFGAYGAQLDYTFLRVWDDHEDRAFSDYRGFELKASLMVFVAKASFLKSEETDEKLRYFSIGIGF